MLILHGSAISNYYQKIKIAILERGLEFEEVLTPPSQKEDYLIKSPMGKIPVLQDGDTWVAESQAIIEYLEEGFTDAPSLYPADLVERANCRQVLNITDLYVDLPLRPFFDMVLYREEMPTGEFWQKAVKTVGRGAKALKYLVKFDPFIMGKQFTYADASAAATWDLAEQIFTFCKIDNPLKELEGYDQYWEMLMNRPHVKKAMRKRNVLRRAQKIAKLQAPPID